MASETGVSHGFTLGSLCSSACCETCEGVFSERNGFVHDDGRIVQYLSESFDAHFGCCCTPPLECNVCIFREDEFSEEFVFGGEVFAALSPQREHPRDGEHERP